MRGSALHRLLARAAGVEPEEAARALPALLLFFFVLGSYFAVRPVRETVGTMLGRSRTASLFVWTWALSIAIVPVFGALVARVRRSTLLPWIYGTVALSLGAAGLAFGADERNALAGQLFYVWISVLNLFVVSVFWSFLLDIFDGTQSKRLFGLVAAGGTAGALCGPTLTSVVVPFVHDTGVLFIGAGGFVVAVLLQRHLLRRWRPGAASSPGHRFTDAPAERAIGGTPFAGFGLVLRSPYLLGVAAFVALAASVTTFLYFEQLRFVEATFRSASSRTQVFSMLDGLVQALAVTAQLFLTGRVAARVGLVVLLVVVPVAMMLGMLALAATGTFLVLAAVFVLRRAGEYAFVRVGREMLFSRVGEETRYKAKSLIDVPMYRGADALTAQLKDGLENAGMTAGPVALLGAAVAGLWAACGWWLGRNADRREGATGPGRRSPGATAPAGS
jgi:ATP:ADP antiporter, AAA family